MSSGPSKRAEAIVAFFVPSACREEVLGDLYQLYRSPLEYAYSALKTVPLVVLSRMRRTSDPQVLVIQAFAAFVSFLGAVWLKDGSRVLEPWEMLRPAVPAAMTVLGLLLQDTYANTPRKSGRDLARGPGLGFVLALASQGILQISHSDLALPGWTVLYGCATSLLLSSAIRVFLPPTFDRLQGAGTSGSCVEQTAGEHREWDTSVSKNTRLILTAGAVVAWVIARSGSQSTRLLPSLLIVLVAWLVSRCR